ncbi:Hypothetical protein I596_2014 [Dokdonella koreensis DS-123]|uniref:Uncharacterized protein n=1 Tax=Dokdonella koreensis DS-123 TaxID=1300342 RepID=A0A160DUS5_9GAMM|nr:Hypothetical protein I596_2014 [Dokdonella koreensis DS-123]
MALLSSGVEGFLPPIVQSTARATDGGPGTNLRTIRRAAGAAAGARRCRGRRHDHGIGRVRRAGGRGLRLALSWRVPPDFWSVPRAFPLPLVPGAP